MDKKNSVYENLYKERNFNIKKTKCRSGEVQSEYDWTWISSRPGLWSMFLIFKTCIAIDDAVSCL